MQRGRGQFLGERPLGFSVSAYLGKPVLLAFVAYQQKRGLELLDALSMALHDGTARCSEREKKRGHRLGLWNKQRVSALSLAPEVWLTRPSPPHSRETQWGPPQAGSQVLGLREGHVQTHEVSDRLLHLYASCGSPGGVLTPNS